MELYLNFPYMPHDVDRANFTLLCRYIKGKHLIKLISVLTYVFDMKAYGYVEVQFHTFLTSPLDGGEWLSSRPSRFTPGKKAPGTHTVGDLVGPGAGLEVVVKSVFFPPGR